MSTDERPLRDVLCEVEFPRPLMIGAEWAADAQRLAREMRAIASLLRETIEEMTCQANPGFGHRCVPCDEDVDRNGELRAKLRALADELEEK